MTKIISIIRNKSILIFIGIMTLFITCSANSQDMPLRFKDESSDYYQPFSTLEDSNITLISEWPWGICRAVAVKDNYVFIGNGKLLQVLEISDPSIPTVVGEYNTGIMVKDIQIRDSLAFVCSRGLQILNITNTDSIYEVAQLNITAAMEVVVSDSFAYVLAQYTPPLVYVVDITNIANPYIRSVTPTASDRPIDMAVKDRFIYVTGDNLGYLTIIDASNPDGLIHYDKFPLTSQSIEIRDTLMYLGKGSYLAIFTISNPIEPVLLDTAYCGISTWFQEIIVQGNYAYSTSDSGLFVFDITDPYETFVVGHLKTCKAACLAIQGDLLHVAHPSGYININIKNVDSLFTEGVFVTCASVNENAVRNNMVYLAAGSSGLLILDVSNPIVPKKIGGCGTSANYLNIIDNYAYVGGRGLWTIDISDSTKPFVTDYYPSTITWSGIIHANNERVYLLDSVLTIFDRSDPAHPAKLSEYSIPYPSGQLATKDSLLFLVVQDDPPYKLIIYNVKDAYNIYEVTRKDIHATGILIKDTIAYIADSVGLIIMSTNPPDFQILSSIETPGSIRNNVRLVLFDKYLYMAYGILVMIDITEPQNPKIILNSEGFSDISVKGEYIYQSGNYFRIYKNNLISSVDHDDYIITEFKLFQNYPNPFNPSTMIKYEIKRQSFVTLKLYNIIGMEIKTIYEGWKTPGQYEVKLNAREYPSGVYYYRLQTNDFEETKKMILLK